MHDMCLAASDGVTRLQGRGLALPEDVLNKAQEMAICELIAEPRVRKAVREPFFKRALVSTGATPSLYPVPAYLHSDPSSTV